MRSSLLIFVFVLFGFGSQACDCAYMRNLREIREVLFHESEAVFIGKVIPTNSADTCEGCFSHETFELEVLEDFKGVKIGQVINGRLPTSCSTLPTAGIWLLYGDFDRSGFINISICGLSRSFIEPERINLDAYTVRPPTMEEIESPGANDDLDWSIELAEIKLQAAKDLKKEVIWLRRQKRKK